MKLFNTLEEIYINPLIIHKATNTIICPVCKKSYKRIEAANSHYNKRDCFKMVDVFRHTESEHKMLQVYKGLMMMDNKLNLVSITGFRKSPQYTVIGKFFLFCHSHDVRSPESYFNFGIDAYYGDNAFAMIPFLMKESTIIKYFDWRKENVSDDESELFVAQYKDIFINDTASMLRSLERGEFKLRHLVSELGESWLTNINPLHEHRLTELLEQYPKLI